MNSLLKSYGLPAMALIAAGALVLAGCNCESKCSGKRGECGKGKCGTEKCTSAEKAKCGSGCATKCATKPKAGCGKCEAKAKACCGTCQKGDKQETSALRNVSSEELVKLLASGDKVTVLDARSGKYDDGLRLPGASALSASASEEEIAKAIPSKDALVVTYCANLKCPASKALATRLVDLGYNNVLEYPEGIEGWKESGGKVTQAN